jgi:hypothetical protein
MEDQYDESVTAPATDDLYGALARPFDVTFQDVRGGVSLEYITGEQAVSRLNETLGVLNWSFRVVEHGIHAEADEVWVLAELTAISDGQIVVRQQFGSQKLKRSRSSGTPLDIGFDLKGATTDALKKCASLVGVGLYLFKKEAQVRAQAPSSGSGGFTNGQDSAPQNQGNVTSMPGAGGDLTCEECGEDLTETKFKDGTSWPPAQLATFGRRKHSRILCMTHYRDANAAKRRAEEAQNSVPF